MNRLLRVAVIAIALAAAATLARAESTLDAVLDAVVRCETGEDCPRKSPRCENGRITTFTAVCGADGRCAEPEAATAACAARRDRCDGLVHHRYERTCASDSECGDALETITQCVAVCECMRGLLTYTTPECDPVHGCKTHRVFCVSGKCQCEPTPTCVNLPDGERPVLPDLPKPVPLEGSHR